jgi:hypothetical protein
MSRRFLIFCFSALAAMVVMIVAAVAFLYRGEEELPPMDARYALAHAVPSNAVMVCFLSEASSLSSPLLSSSGFSGLLADYLNSEPAGSIAGRPMALSMHYSGTLAPLYVFDAGPASSTVPDDASALIAFAEGEGFYAEFVNCSQLAPSGPLASRSLVLVARTKVQISMSKNHLVEGRSIMDAEGYAAAAHSAPADVVFIPFENARILFEKAVSRKSFRKRYPDEAGKEYSAAASFFQSLSGWASLSLEHERSFESIQHYSESDFMCVLENDTPAVSAVASILPSYTCFALTLPMHGADEYVSSYSAYLESSGKKATYIGNQDKLERKTGISPMHFFDRLDPDEVASAMFMCGDVMERVNLLKINHADELLLRGTGESVLPEEPKALPYAYGDYVASVFGKYFRLPDESFFTYMDGWLISGSARAVNEYVSGWALDYPLKMYMADAGAGDFFADRSCSCIAYINMPKESSYMADILNKEVLALYENMKGTAGYSPLVMSVFSKNGQMHTDIKQYQLELKRSRAPMGERDTVVTVPAGPFKVVNSGTGRTNIFYQQKNGAICLQEEDGRGLWGVPFKHALCGTAHNIDYYANGNKQILFGAGSSLYLIDRHGRFVSGFPVDLGKGILIGPDVYDFNSVNAYNVLVLHDDNTVEMYNLKGKKPDPWKGIAPDEKIKSLPERLVVGGKTYWVVRTSLQVLIYPFYGGEPLNSSEGDMMFLPNAEVKVKGSNMVEARCYDGKVRTVKVK